MENEIVYSELICHCPYGILFDKVQSKYTLKSDYVELPHSNIFIAGIQKFVVRRWIYYLKYRAVISS
jgi:hypothetical protein